MRSLTENWGKAGWLLGLAGWAVIAWGGTWDHHAAESARGLILVVGDGMGVGQHTLAYYFGEDYPPADFEHVGLMATHPAERVQVTESGAAASAMATGHKTNRAVLGLDARGQRVETVLELAEARGLVTGLVTTAAITDATPAAFAAHVSDRSEHREIARQMTSAGIEILLGGGREHFSTTKDGDDLLASLTERGVQIIFDLDGQLDADRPVLGLFGDGELPVPPKRKPTLEAMARLALDRLKGHPQGFFLMIEDEGTDTYSHRNDTKAVMAVLGDLMSTVRLLLDFQAQNPEVLLVFLGDHDTGGLRLQEKGARPGKLKWSTRGHTGNFVPVFSTGPGSAAFGGVLDNAEVGRRLMDFIRQL